jgi:DNA-binding Lrp family transcriptional regulator
VHFTPLSPLWRVQRDEIVLTDRDQELLAALAEQRVAVMAQAAYWLGVSERTAGRRVRRLEQAGLLESRRLFERGSAMVKITPAGLRRIGSPLGKPGQKLDEYRHDVGVGWLWTAAREGAFGEMAEIVSERGMRSHDARLERMSPAERLLTDDPEHYGIGVGTLTAGGRPERHFPDLLLRSPAGHTIAVELELSVKGRRRLDGVMNAYASDGRVDAVLYVVPDARLAAKVRESAVRAGISDLVYVRRLAPGGIRGVAAVPETTVARAPARTRQPELRR